MHGAVQTDTAFQIGGMKPVCRALSTDRRAFKPFFSSSPNGHPLIPGSNRKRHLIRLLLCLSVLAALFPCGVAAGDEILVKIKFRAQDDLEYLVLEDYLPAGFEVVKKNVYDDYQPYAHSERWDNRMVFFLTKIRKGDVYEIGYTMRAELPGNFLAKPARMECMYEPTIQGWSAPAKFVVRKK